MATVVRNPMASLAARSILGAGVLVSGDALAFHHRLPGYVPTPLVETSHALAARFGVSRVLVKDESSRLGLPSFKLLGASWATYRLLVERLGYEPAWSTIEELAAAVAPLGRLELVTATDGNHGRAVARVAHLLGFGARVFVAEGTAAARIAAIEGEGASVEEVAGDYDHAVARSAEVAAERGPEAVLVSDTSWDGYVDTPRRVIEGYTTIFGEVDDALRAAGSGQPQLVVVPVGVGALAAAACAHYRSERQSGTVLVGVEPQDADCVLRSVLAGAPTTVPGPHRSMMVGLNCGTPSLVAWPELAAGLDWCVAVEDERAATAMRLLADEGVVAGETGAAALAGLDALAQFADAHASRAEIGLTPDATVLVICTEGATDPANYRRIVGRSHEEVKARAGADLAISRDDNTPSVDTAPLRPLT